ncbi:MAG TPA: RluA family pseudouridine synthase [Kofleriaceae bacterium]
MSEESEEYELVVGRERAGERVDAVIAAEIAGLSRAQAQRLIEDGRVSVNGVVVAKAGQKLRLADVVDIEVPPPEPMELVAEPMALVIAYEDEQLIVVDKPAGLVVHPAAGHPRGTLVNGLLAHVKDFGGIGGTLRPGIVHRLDKDTSGLIVVAKTEAAHAGLTAEFARKSAGEASTIVREYLAIAAPGPTASAGTYRTYYGRHPTDRKRFSSKVATGKRAVTHWQVEQRLANAALVRLRLETGRTHQIRVHAADHGWPLLGDTMYGRPSPLIGRQALHAERLGFDHPVTGTRVELRAEVPEDFRDALTRSST